MQEYGGPEFTCAVSYSAGLFENWHGMHSYAYVVKIYRCFFFPSFKFPAFWFRKSTFFFFFFFWGCVRLEVVMGGARRGGKAPLAMLRLCGANCPLPALIGR